MNGKWLTIYLLIFSAAYASVKELGGGFHSKTWLLDDEADNTTYVLKEVKTEIDKNDLSGKREIHFGKKLSSAPSHVGKDHVGRLVKHVKVDSKLQLVSIFEGTQLEKLVFQFNTENKMFEPTAWLTWLRNTTEGRQVMKSLFRQLLLGVKFCHDNGVIHRDITLANIVICFEKTNGSCRMAEPFPTDNVHLRIIDFGSAVDSFANRYLYGKQGPVWEEQNVFKMPPEAIIDESWSIYSLSKKYDSWSVGHTILEFILGSPDVFSSQDFASLELLRREHLDDQLDFSDIRLAGMVEQCIGLPEVVDVEKMNRLATCTEDGYAGYIRNRDSLNLGFTDMKLLKLVRLLLEADPELRIGVDEALRHPYFADSTHISLYYCAIALAFVVIMGVIWYGLKQGTNKKKKKEKE